MADADFGCMVSFQTHSATERIGDRCRMNFLLGLHPIEMPLNGVHNVGMKIIHIPLLIVGLAVLYGCVNVSERRVPTSTTTTTTTQGAVIVP